MYVPTKIGRYVIDISAFHQVEMRSGILYRIEKAIASRFPSLITDQPYYLLISGTKLKLKLTEEEKNKFEYEQKIHRQIVSFGAAINVMRYPNKVQ